MIQEKVRSRERESGKPDTVGVVYIAINSVNHKKYIGITSCSLNKRIREHWNGAKKHRANTLFSRALMKYGKDNITFHKILDCGSFEKAKELEKYLIKTLKPEYNLTLGGDGTRGFMLSEEHKKKLSIAKKGKPGSRLGTKQSPESIAKMVATKAKNPCRYWLGKKRDTEIHIKMAEGRKRRRESGMRSEAEDLSIKKAIAAASVKLSKPVICLNDGIIFSSAKEASKHYGLSKNVAGMICKGEMRSKRGLLFKWYKNDN